MNDQDKARETLGQAIQDYLVSIPNESERHNASIHGFEAGPFTVERFRGFKGGARICVFAEHEGEIYTALIKEKNRMSDNTHWNQPQSFLNGPAMSAFNDAKVNVENGAPVGDMPISAKQCSVGVVQRETGLKIDYADIKDFKMDTPDGFTYEIFGIEGHNTKQMIEPFRVTVKSDNGLPEITTANKSKGDRLFDIQWVNIRDIRQETPDRATFDVDGEQQELITIFLETLRCAVRDIRAEKTVENNPDVSYRAIEAIKTDQRPIHEIVGDLTALTKAPSPKTSKPKDPGL